MKPLVDPFDLVEPGSREEVKEYFERLYVQLDAEMDDQWKALGPTDPPQTIYHYTSAGGLLGIVEKGQIFLTDAFFLNDQSELIYGRNLALDVLRTRQLTAKGAVAEFLRIGIEKFDPFDELHMGFRYYVACFCRNGNLLSQWRAYGVPGSGFSLGFASAPLVAKEYVSDVPHVVLHRIEYSLEKQRRLVEFITDRCCELLAKDLARAKSPFARDLIISGYFTTLAVQLTGLFPQFKHAMFEEEQEWRLTTSRIPEEYKGRIAFRESGKNIVPYIALDLRVTAPEFDGRIPLTRVFHAPTAEPDLRKRSVETFLREKGYGSVHIEGSEIPLRSS